MGPRIQRHRRNRQDALGRFAPSVHVGAWRAEIQIAIDDIFGQTHTSTATSHRVQRLPIVREGLYNALRVDDVDTR